jgi:hypothetical protein
MLFTMSLFIHSENQTLLWNIISNMEITNTVFVQGSPQKSIWFKNIIEEFYIKIYGKQLTISELRELNRQVITYMTNNLREIQKKVTRQPALAEIPKKNVFYEPQTEYSRNSAGGNSEVYNDLFSKRQKDYEAMIVKPVPPKVEFSENLKDEPISNMEELLKAQQQQREYDLQLQVTSTTYTGHPKVMISKEDISVAIDGIIENDPKKKVTWSDEHEVKNEIKNDITLLKSQIEILSEKLDNFRNDLLSEIKEFLSPKTEKIIE